MTAQQLSHFRSALMCLFEQATGKPSPFASNVLLSACNFRLGAGLLVPVTTHTSASGGRQRQQQPG
jgi:hypothetical protein